MGLNFREDKDLVFLKYSNNEDLEILVNYLTKNQKGKKRFNSELAMERKYVDNTPNHQAYWDLIAAELQTYGSNGVARVIRGNKGVYYKEILIDVCKKLKVNFNNKSDVVIIERNLLMKILTDSLEKMDNEELKKVIEELDLKMDTFNKQAVLVAIQAAIKAGGFKSYQLAMIVANAVSKQLLGRGIALGGNAALARVLGIFAGPVGWTIMGLWTAVDLAGPAYRVTIPSVIQVAYMRAVFDEES
ncbi:oxidoreductase [Anaerobacillus arseniciselenatis]|uniref:Oxidoreductase n=1 Tax=Anaerobacillus arseniciselenatis TaxID=85682 RepID=A0A1S2LVL4_9BACI|nr:DUF3944 domain-containing protein [Anaerobacillus arseniciselenatis]OIJ16213.1 oxidoreductase [Anaerobacillus arseniciselenatis]